SWMWLLRGLRLSDRIRRDSDASGSSGCAQVDDDRERIRISAQAAARYNLVSSRIRPDDHRTMHHTEVAIVGGGIVGPATAHILTMRFPRLRVTVIEKEPEIGRHQTGHNSGVIHSGIYYRPGTLKARNCREGRVAMEAFCTEEGIPFEQCGKVIVATSEH